ncbi:LysM peptidoglycan-binding domain-containing protein, partial [Anaerosalibacter bizertensis]|nr:LysM peptidoglycan-binding domain-containing protein [Anaerosalibacter bizertensis]
NKQKSAEVTGKPREKTYIVKPGDVLFRIGKKYSVGWSEIAKYNGMKNPNKIYPGDRIKIPVK